MTIDDDDLHAVLRQLYPQGYALLRFEGGAEILRIGAREVLNNPRVADDTLAPRELSALGRAVIARGQRYRSLSEGLLARADKKAAEASASAKACSGGYNTEAKT